VFEESLGFQLTPQTTFEELKILAESLQLAVAHFTSWEDVFHLIFVDKIEQKISQGPLILKNYPPSLSAYSRISEEGWAERFEFYWNGFEIANAFEEITDPSEQKVRFERDLALKKSLGIEAPELDVEFLQMMERAMPPTGGIALGLERFFAAWKGFKTVQF
jgi:lysyl-tRNA synthetase class 2